MEIILYGTNFHSKKPEGFQDILLRHKLTKILKLGTGGNSKKISKVKRGDELIIRVWGFTQLNKGWKGIHCGSAGVTPFIAFCVTSGQQLLTTIIFTNKTEKLWN
jgi:hypothetical protein